MPIVVQHSPDARAVGAAAYQGGLGMFMQAQQEMAQRQNMQQQQIAASERMAQFQAQQDANRILWNANNQDVMANRDMGRAQQMGQFRQGLEREQFDWQQGAQGDQRNWQAEQADIQRQHQRSMAQEDDERQRAIQAEQLRNQSPFNRQMRDFDETERRIRETPMEDSQRADALTQLQKKRMDLIGANKQPTPEEQKKALEQEWEASSVPMPDGSRMFKGKNGWDQVMPSDFNKSPDGVKMKIEQDKQVADAKLKAEEAKFAAEARRDHEKQQRESFRAFYEANRLKEDTDSEGNTKYTPVDPGEIKRQWQAMQAIEEEMFGKPGGGGPPQGGQQQSQQGPPLVRTEQEWASIPPGTTYRAADGTLRQKR